MAKELTHLDEIFREDFKSPFHVAKNGGSIAGNPVINNGLTLLDSADKVDYIKSFNAGVLTKFGFILRGRFDFDSGQNYASLLAITKGGTQTDQFLYVSNSGTTQKLFLRTTNGTVYRDFISTDNITSEEEVEIVGVWDNGWTVYLNGEELAGSASGTGIPSSIPFNQATEVVFGDGAPSVGMTGEYKEFRFFNVDITAKEAELFYNKGIFNYSNKFVEKWPLHDQVGSSSFTTTGVLNGKDLTINGATKLNEDGYSTDGGDYLQSAQGLFEDTGELTISIWAKLASKASTQALASYEDSSLDVGGLILYYHTGGQYFFYTGSSSSPAIFNESSNQPELVHIVGTYDGTNTSIYVNGEKGTDSVSPTAPQITSSMLMTAFMRANLVSQKCANGTEIYDIDLGKEALTPIQVKDLYHKGLKYYGNR